MCGRWRRRRREGNRCRWRGSWWRDPDSLSAQRVANNPRSTLLGLRQPSVLRYAVVVSQWLEPGKTSRHGPCGCRVADQPVIEVSPPAQARPLRTPGHGGQAGERRHGPHGHGRRRRRRDNATGVCRHGPGRPRRAGGAIPREGRHELAAPLQLAVGRVAERVVRGQRRLVSAGDGADPRQQRLIPPEIGDLAALDSLDLGDNGRPSLPWEGGHPPQP